MTDLQTTVRQAIRTLRMRYRVTEIPQADDEAVAAIMRAAGDAVITDGLSAAHTALLDPLEPQAALKERTDELESLLGEILGAFKRSPNGYNARAKLEQMEQWQERLGGQA